MSKSATQRREEKLAKELHALALRNTEQLKIIWGKLLNLWIMETIRRGKLGRLSPVPTSKAEIYRKRPAPESIARELCVYGTLEKAERLLALCSKLGPEVERLVGAETRDQLNQNCAKAVALAFDSRMYSLTVKLSKPKPQRCNKAASATTTSTKGDGLAHTTEHNYCRHREEV